MTTHQEGQGRSEKQVHQDMAGEETFQDHECKFSKCIPSG